MTDLIIHMTHKAGTPVAAEPVTPAEARLHSKAVRIGRIALYKAV